MAAPETALSPSMFASAGVPSGSCAESGTEHVNEVSDDVVRYAHETEANSDNAESISKINVSLCASVTGWVGAPTPSKCPRLTPMSV